MARIVTAREHHDFACGDATDEAMRAYTRAFSLRHPAAWCHSTWCFGRLFLCAYKHRSYSDARHGMYGLPGYYRAGAFLPFTTRERIREQQACLTSD